MISYIFGCFSLAFAIYVMIRLEVTRQMFQFLDLLEEESRKARLNSLKGED